MQSASATGTLMGALEQRLGEESAAPSALLLPIPADGGDGGEGDPLANLKTDIAKAKGRPVLLKTTSGGFAEGPGSAPQKDRNLSTTMGHSTGLIREQCPVW